MKAQDGVVCVSDGQGLIRVVHQPRLCAEVLSFGSHRPVKKSQVKPFILLNKDIYKKPLTMNLIIL